MPKKQKKRKTPVDPSELPLVDQVGYYLREAEDVARVANRGNKSLAGSNLYAEKFHTYQIQTGRLLRKLQASVSLIANRGLEQTMLDIDEELTYFFNPKTSLTDRRDLRRHIETLTKTEIEPALQSRGEKDQDDEFLPMQIVDGTRGYVCKVARQINVCFQNDCLDACGVMIRRLIETLIIEVFEKKGISDRITDANGNYILFKDLVNKLVSTQETPIGKTTRQKLPNIAVVLNNCAHSRAFNISRGQLMQYQTPIVIATQELVGLWDVRGK